MAEFEEKLNQILSSPQAMEQIMSLASSLSGEGETPAAPPEGQSVPSEGLSLPSAGGLSGLLGSLDPAMISKVMTLLSTYQNGSDEKTRLLEAMKPFLRPERQSKLDRAVQITRLSRVIRSAINMFGGNGHV